MLDRRAALLMGAFAAVLCFPCVASAQNSIVITAGNTPSSSVTPGSKFPVPVIANMSNAGGANIASFSANIAWNATQMTLDSIAPVPTDTLTANTANKASGTATIATFNTTGRTTTGTVAVLWFTASLSAVGTTYISISPTAAGNDVGTPILSTVRSRALGICVANTVFWGDANGDHNVNIIDAQQIGRFSVGLSVANVTLIQLQGDVNADNNINIIDAQQIARFAVSLPVTTRVNTTTPIPPVVSDLRLTATTASMQIGAVTQLIPVVQDVQSLDFTGCSTITWASANSSIATVDANGLVTGVANGVTSITATTSGFSAQAAVNVGIGSVPAVMSLVQGDQQFGVSGSTYSIRPQVRVVDAQQRAVPGVAVTFSTTNSSISVPGTTATTVTVNTDSAGIAQPGGWLAVWTGVTRATMPNTLVATASGLAAVTFNGNAVDPNAAASGCMLTTAGQPFCVGDYESEMLHAGITPQDTNWGKLPVAVPNAPALASLSPTFNGEFTCGVSTSGQGFCWGFNSVGQLGDGTTVLNGNATPVAGGLTFSKISTGRNHACGLTTQQKAFCWGLGQFGMLGDGTIGQVRTSPVAVAGNLSFVDIATSSTATCAVTTNGQTFCWGQAFYIDPSGAPVLTPKRILGAPPFTRIAIASSVICGIASGGTVQCSGAGSPALGDGSLTSRSTFAPASLPVPAREISAANLDVCAYGTDGGLYCWGNNSNGAIGVGDRSTHSTPTLVAFANPLRSQQHGFGFCYQDATGLPFCTGRFAIGDGIAGPFNNLVRLSPVPVQWVEGTAGVAASMVPNGNTTLFAPAGAPTGVAPSVIVRDFAGNPVAGVTVAFAVTGGGGSLGAASATTDNAGVASATSWTLGSTLGANTVSATSGSLPKVVFTGTGTTTPTVATLTGGDNQVFFTNTVFPAPLAVTVKDASGNGVQGVAVTFSAATGGGTVLNPVTNAFATSAIAVTNAQGVASTTWLGTNVVGTQTATAVTSLGTITFNGRTVVAVQGATICNLSSSLAAFCSGFNNVGSIGDGTNTTRTVPTAVNGGLTFSALSDGFGDHTCGLTNTGAAFCWGANGFGQLGDGTVVDRNVPVAVSGNFTFTQIAVNSSSTCGITTASALVCWGSAGFGLYLDGSVGTAQSSPTVVNTGSLSFTRIALGGNHYCGLAAAGTLHCWGLNSSGQIGNGTTALSTVPVLAPALVLGGRTYIAVAAGSAHTCAIATGNALFCWGTGSSGVLGTGTTSSSLSPAPVASSATFAAVAAGTLFTCARTTQNQPLCFGLNSSGQLGDGTLTLRSTPTAAVGGAVFSTLRVASVSACGRVASGQPYCWGSNTLGQLGTSTTAANQSVMAPVRWVEGTAGIPVGMTLSTGAGQGAGVGTSVPVAPAVVVRDFAGNPVAGATVTFTPANGGSVNGGTVTTGSNGIAAVGSWTLGPTAGANTLAVSVSGTPSTQFSATGTVAVGSVAIASGDNQVQSLGAAFFAPLTVVVRDASNNPVSGVSVAFATTSGGAVVASSVLSNANGIATVTPSAGSVVGNNTITASVGAAPPVTFTSRTAPSITGVGFSRCELSSTGAAFCWGDNVRGQLGDGTNTTKNVPSAVSGALVFASLAEGTADHQCGLTSAGAAFCWGSNGFGELGDGTTTDRNTPTAVSGGLTFTQLAVSFNSTCGRVTTGAVFCWGSSAFGLYGDGVLGTARLTPTVVVAGSTTFASIAVSQQHACGVSTSGSMFCWGVNSSGQLGDGTFANRSVVAIVPDGRTYSAVTVGPANTCGLSNGAAFCWGTSVGGILGSGATTSQPTPGAVSGGLTFSNIAIGISAVCGRTTAGAVFCWGTNTSGQLGDGTTTSRSAPTQVAGLAANNTLSVRGSSSCARATGGLPYCWGSNTNGSLGDGTFTQSQSPVAVRWVEGTPGIAASVAVTTGNFQGAGLGTAVPIIPSVTVRDFQGAVISGATVTFAATSGGGSVTGANATTASNGIASVGSWIMGATSGPNTMSATVTGIPSAVFSATATAAPGSISIVAGDNQVVPTFSGYFSPLSVLVKDASNNPISGLTVSFAVSSGSATLATTALTNASGIVSLTPSTTGTLGVNTITVSAGTAAPIVFTSRTAPITSGRTRCELSSAGAAFCWGENFRGQFGNGAANTSSSLPVAVSGGLTFTSLADGSSDHMCGLTSAGAAFCWGANAFGELGDGTTTDQSVPVAVTGGFTFTQLAVTLNSTCGRTSAGAIVCWGSSGFGLFGDGIIGTVHATPTTVLAGTTTFSAVALGDRHVCGVATSGSLFCWGLGTSGQLGDNTFTSKTVPTLVPDGRSYAAVTAGATQTCGITTAGAAFCWGGQTGGLGNGTSTTSSSSPLAVAGGLAFTSISSAAALTCARSTTSSVFCWGDNSLGALGDGTNINRTSPTLVPGLTATSVRVRATTTCARSQTGHPYCWGNGGNGAIGDGTFTSKNLATPVRWIEGTPGVAVGMTIGNGNGQGAPVSTAVPVAPSVIVRDFAGTIVSGSPVTFAVALGGGSLTGANATSDATGNATVGSWTLGPSVGANTLTASIAGLPSSSLTATGTAAAGSVSLVSGDNQVMAGGNTLAPIVVLVKDASNNPLANVSVAFTNTSGGGLFGNQQSSFANTNSLGQASIFWNVGGTVGPLTATATVAGASPITLSARSTGFVNGYARCDLNTAGAAFCWGDDTHGQLGRGTVSSSVSVPVAVQGGLVFSTLAEGVADHACGITTSGAAFCWGSNGFGQLGNGSTTDSSIPVAVTGGFTFTQIAVSNNSSCGITTAGAIVCWGSTGNSLFGDGVVGLTRLTPTIVNANGTTFTKIALHFQHACAIATSGSMFCWGVGSSGQLGDGTFLNRAQPTQIPDGRSYSAVAVGRFASCGIASGGSAFCWGNSTQTGNGGTTTSGPTAVSGGLLFSSISLSDNHACGVTTSNAAFCWGVNSSGEAGIGSSSITLFTPTAVQGGVQFASVSTRQFTSCGRATNGQPYCWGYGGFGQIGDNAFTNRLLPSPVNWVEGTPGVARSMTISFGNGQTANVSTQVPASPTVIVRDFAGNPVAGVSVTFAATAGGGNITAPNGVTNSNGQVSVGTWTLGPAAGTNSMTATATGLPVVTFSATGVVGTGGTITIVSGDNQVAPQGFQFTAPQTVLVKNSSNAPVSGISVTFTATVGGGFFNTGNVASTTVVTNSSGIASAVLTPGNAVGTQTVVAAIGGFSSATFNGRTAPFTNGVARCELLTTGASRCWGDNARGWIGDGTTTPRLTPTPTIGGVTFTSLADGVADHVCGLTSAGAAFCWGSNSFGQIGDGTTVDKLQPTAVPGIPALVQIAVGGYMTCGRTASNQIFCWGWSGFGLYGDGVLGDVRLAPTLVNTGGVTLTSISLGQYHACGIAASGLAFCWGNGGQGELGTGTFTNRSVATNVGDGRVYSKLTLGDWYTCGLSSGNAFCFGWNGNGRLGTSAPVNGFTNTPSAVTGGLNFTQLSAGWGTTCGRTATSQAHCWGLNANGAVGDGTLIDRSAPTPVLGGVQFAKVVPQANTSCGRAGNGQVYCWGFNGSGYVGDGSTVQRNAPVASTWPEGTAGTAVSLIVNAGNNQTAVRGTSPSTSPSVLVKDFAGNPVAGITVTFTVTSGSGSITTATAVTNASGIATQSTWTLGPNAGTNTMTAAASGLPTVIFTITGS